LGLFLGEIGVGNTAQSQNLLDLNGKGQELSWVDFIWR